MSFPRRSGRSPTASRTAGRTPSTSARDGSTFSARLDQQLAEISPGYVIEQCKTKFGTLRYYARPEDADHTDAARFSDIIRDAEDESATVCEDCGQPAQ